MLGTPATELRCKYLTFVLGADEYAIDIASVQEILAPAPITPLPGTPADVVGAMNVRGAAIPVVQLSGRLGRAGSSRIEPGIVVIVTHDGARTGLLVDRVLDVGEIAAERIERVPAIGAAAPPPFVRGLVTDTDRVRILLDVGAVLQGDGRAQRTFSQPDDLDDGAPRRGELP